MGKITGFMELARIQEASLPPQERVTNYREFVLALTDDAASSQGARCMDCGIPFCQSGCPVNNVIPDWNDLVYRHQWREALDVLHSTNNFPEFTGRICPAPCEAACTLNINDDAVGIKSIEHFIIDKGWDEGWVLPQPPATKTGRRVAVVGSGPAGLACAQQLARAGHDVVLYEKADRIGGLLRYGIPDFKMERHLVDRRMAQMSLEGVTFRPGVHVGKDVAAESLLAEYEAVVLTGGAEAPRDLPVPGRDLAGIHFAMEFLPQQNRVVAGDKVQGQILATGKHVVVIGGGDTGSDCVGTSNRQRAQSITQFELLPQPPEQEDKPVVWPYWPIKLRTSSSHQEGCQRDWAVATKRFEGSERARGEARRRARRMAEGRERHDEDGRGPGIRVRDEGRSGAVGDGLSRTRAGRPARSSSASKGTRAATCAPTRKITGRRCRRCSRPATCAAASRWSSGRSARAASARARSTSS